MTGDQRADLHHRLFTHAVSDPAEAMDAVCSIQVGRLHRHIVIRGHEVVVIERITNRRIVLHTPKRRRSHSVEQLVCFASCVCVAMWARRRPRIRDP